MNKKSIILLVICLFGAILAAPNAALAANDFSEGLFSQVSFDCYMEGDCTFCDALQILVNVSRIILLISGAVAWIFLLWGSIGFITANGNSEKIETNKKLMESALFGIFIILVSWQLTMMILAVIINPNGLTTGEVNLFSTAWNLPKCE